MQKSGHQRDETTLRNKTKQRELVRARTLEEIWTFLRDGFTPAEDKLVEYLRAAYHGLTLGNWAVDDPDGKVRRRTSPHHYISHGPPAWFEAPFCILQVIVREANQDYMTHGGEELLLNLPGSDAIEYEFFWPEGVAPPWQATGAKNTETVTPHQLIRINPSLPHRNRPIRDSGRGVGAATAWIILRPLSLSPATVILHDPHTGVTSGMLPETHHQYSEPRLRELTGAQLLLVASGLLEKLRVHRLRSEMTVEELSTSAGLNRSYVGRLERLDIDNFSIQTLYELSRQIDLDVLGCLRQLQWAHQVQPATGPSTDHVVAYEKPPLLGHHVLHPSTLRLGEGQSCKIDMSGTSGEIISVIMTEGRMVPGLADEMEVPVVHAGHVFHARGYADFTIHALSAVTALVIRYSHRCTCANTRKEQQS